MQKQEEIFLSKESAEQMQKYFDKKLLEGKKQSTETINQKGAVVCEHN
jgi:hypothetical protein